MGKSTVVTGKGTILQTAIKILKGKRAMAPSEIARTGVATRKLRIPRGRTLTYVSQIIQSAMWGNAYNSANPVIYRDGRGRYTTSA